MAEKSTIARPYAQAAFDLAQQKSELKTWSDMLSMLSSVVSDEQMKNLFGNPQVGKKAPATKLWLQLDVRTSICLLYNSKEGRWLND